jgi:uncharacterized protein (DUF433 family)
MALLEIEPFQADPLPLGRDQYGTIRVGNSRLTLDTIVARYHQGDTPADIVEGFPSLSLADVHAVLAYYLRHQEELDAYLAERERIGEEYRREIESRPEYAERRARLRALRDTHERVHGG